MNFRRGLFRLWLVVSLLFIAAVFAFGIGTVRASFDERAEFREWDNVFTTLVPSLCGTSRGKLGTDYEPIVNDAGKAPAVEPPNPFDTCWFRINDFRRLYPEYGRMSDRDLLVKTSKDAGEPAPKDEPDPWQTILTLCMTALGIPLGVLALGAALIWAISGFKRSVES